MAQETAKYISDITVIDPDTSAPVEITVYKHRNGCLFAVDTAFLLRYFGDDETPVIPDPFGEKGDAEVVALEGC